MKLISCTDYVLKLDESKISTETNGIGYIGFTDKVTDYANFLKQPLELGMFIACDKEGNAIKSYYKDGVEHFDGIGVEELNEAKDRVMFEGFSGVSVEKYNAIRIYFNDEYFESFVDGKPQRYATIELLRNKKLLTLTPNAIKQLK